MRRHAAARGNNDASTGPTTACLSCCSLCRSPTCEPPCQRQAHAAEGGEIETNGGEVNVVVRESRGSSTESGYNTATERGSEAIG